MTVVQSKVDSMTVFNDEHVDTKKQPMFFGKPLGIQRYDSYKYPVFEKLTTQMLGYFWRPEEVSLQKDRGDYQSLSPEQKHIFTSNLKYQVLLDSVQGRGPGMAFPMKVLVVCQSNPFSIPFSSFLVSNATKSEHCLPVGLITWM